jgi:lipopolysaccharide export system permease protein
MGILSRYVIKEILKAQMALWLGLGFLIFLLEWVGRTLGSGGDPWLQLIFYFVKFPSYLQLVFPMSVLFAFLMVFGQMARNREIVAVQSLGYSNRQILKPALMALFIASVPFYFVMNHLAPAGLKKHFEIYNTRMRSGEGYEYQSIKKEKIWYRNQEVLYTIYYFDPQKAELYGVTIYTFDADFHIVQSLYAEKAVWKKDHWLLENGRIYVTDKRLRTPIIESFTQRKSYLIEEPSKLKRVEWAAESLSQPELSRAIDQSKALGINTAEWETMWHSRWSFFSVAFVFVLLAFPRATRFHRAQGASKDGVFVAAVSMIYWLLFNLGVNLGNSGRLPPMVAAWLPTLLFVSGVYFYNRRQTLKDSSD